MSAGFPPGCVCRRRRNPPGGGPAECVVVAVESREVWHQPDRLTLGRQSVVVPANAAGTRSDET